MGLRWPLSRGSQFKLYFHLDDEKTEDHAKGSISPLFEGSSINNTELRDILTRAKCMVIQNITWNKMTHLRVERYIQHEIISRLFPFIKIKFKVTPIERQSL